MYKYHQNKKKKEQSIEIMITMVINIHIFNIKITNQLQDNFSLVYIFSGKNAKFFLNEWINVMRLDIYGNLVFLY